MATEMPAIPPPTATLMAGMAGAVGSEGRSNVQATRSVRTAPSQDGEKVAVQPRNLREMGEEEKRKQEEKEEKELTRAVGEMNERSDLLRRNLQFSVDDDSGRMVIKVVDSQTDEVIRQIPKEEMLEIARSLEKAEGLLFRAKA